MTKTEKYLLIGGAVVVVVWFMSSRSSSSALTPAHVGSPAAGSGSGVLGDLKQAASGGVNALFDWLK